MSLLRTFPTRGVLALPRAQCRQCDRVPWRPPLLWLTVRLAHGVTVPWDEVTVLSTVSTDPAELSY